MSLTAPAHHLARGRLMRAIVSLPANLCPKGEPLHERVIFFDAPRVNPADYLQTLLSHTWHSDASAWPCDSIYNVQAASALVEEGVSEDVDARLFEVGWGGPEGVTFADPARVDLFLSPVLKARLLGVLEGLRSGGVERLRSPAEPAEYPPLPEPFIGVQNQPWGGHAEVIRCAIGEQGVVSVFTAEQMREQFDLGRASATAEAEPAPEVAA